ncbi:hypothetical protein GCM10025782_09990 [Pedococcus ginsenosidimutans]|uniref:Uncharacterized protein n=1 Tax=Pedococcus ginsenosidimutans TaxID=490570 RepID=A0ABP8XUZ3_9MICO
MVCPAGVQKMGVTNNGPVCFVPITGPPWKISGGVPTAASLVVLVGGPDVEVEVADVAHPVEDETARVTPRSRALPGALACAEHATVAWLVEVESVVAAPAALTAAPVNSAVAEAARTAIALPLLRIRGFTGNPFRRAGAKVSARLALECTPRSVGCTAPETVRRGQVAVNELPDYPRVTTAGVPGYAFGTTASRRGRRVTTSTAPVSVRAGVGQAPVSVRPRRRGAASSRWS